MDYKSSSLQTECEEQDRPIDEEWISVANGVRWDKETCESPKWYGVFIQCPPRDLRKYVYIKQSVISRLRKFRLGTVKDFDNNMPDFYICTESNDIAKARDVCAEIFGDLESMTISDIEIEDEIFIRLKVKSTSMKKYSAQAFRTLTISIAGKDAENSPDRKHKISTKAAQQIMEDLYTVLGMRIDNLLEDKNVLRLSTLSSYLRSLREDCTYPKWLELPKHCEDYLDEMIAAKRIQRYSVVDGKILVHGPNDIDDLKQIVESCDFQYKFIQSSSKSIVTPHKKPGGIVINEHQRRGTLGMYASFSATGRFAGITHSHVSFENEMTYTYSNDEDQSQEQIQIGPCIWSRHTTENESVQDIAVIDVQNQRLKTYIRNANKKPVCIFEEAREKLSYLPVSKHGGGTNLTRGTITETKRVEHVGDAIVDAIIVRGDMEKFCDNGDSGAVVFHNQASGKLLAISVVYGEIQESPSDTEGVQESSKPLDHHQKDAGNKSSNNSSSKEVVEGYPVTKEEEEEKKEVKPYPRDTQSEPDDTPILTVPLKKAFDNYNQAQNLGGHNGPNLSLTNGLFIEEA